MCGRFTLAFPPEELAEAFGLDELPELAPRYNIAPSQPVLVVRARRGGGRSAATLRWGFASAAEDADDAGAAGPLLINARSESAATRPAFRLAFREGRCLIPAGGFYEWKRDGGRRQPYYVRRRDRLPFAFAGLWQPPESPSVPGACTILTTAPNPLVAELHDRMPAILPPEAHAQWLDTQPQPVAALRDLLVPYPDEELELFAVRPLVNRADREGPELIERDEDPERGRQGSLFP